MNKINYDYIEDEDFDDEYIEDDDEDYEDDDD